MIDQLKKMAVEKGMAMMQSPTVAKILASEKAGVVIEKAMTLPFKVSGAITKQKEKLVALFDLATQEDMDDLRRALSKVEAVLDDIKKKSKNPAGTSAE
jgi:hypothetical protein